METGRAKKRKEEARSAFHASISNELRKPLIAIFEMVETLSKTKLDDQQKRCIEIIKISSESLQRIVDSLLTNVGGGRAIENRVSQHIDALLSICSVSHDEGVVSDSDLQYLKNKKKDIRILFAEDDAINQLYLAAFLRSQGWRVDTAYNGRVALEMFEAGKYDLIILDGQMPEMDGFETAKKIRELETKETHTPILAISGYAIPGEKEKFITSGMDAYLPKPVDESKLLKLISQLTT